MTVAGDFNCVCDPFLDRMPPIAPHQNQYSLAPWHLVEPVIDHFQLSDTAVRLQDADKDDGKTRDR